MTAEPLRPAPALPSDHAGYPPPPPPFLRDIRATHNAPAMPQEPARHNQSWIKWLVLVLILIAIGAGVLLARNMGAFPGMGGSASQTPSSSAAPADKNAISAEDKARPMPSWVLREQEMRRFLPTTHPWSPSTRPRTMWMSLRPRSTAHDQLTVANPGHSRSDRQPCRPAPDTAVTPNPAPARPAKPQSRPAVRNGSPTLDDLLD